jgi:DNA replication protein DnaC
MTALDLDGMLKRLHLPTVRRLYPECELRAEAEDQSYRDFLATLIAEEVAHRAQTRIERSVRKARFPFLRTIEEFDFTFQTSVRLQLLGSYLGPELVTEGRSLVLYGPSGTGKTHLAIAVAYRAIQNGFEALFTSAAEMIERLSVATRRGELARTLAEYTHPTVLVIDEVGYLTVGGDAANLMFQVVNERYLLRRPMLFTTNKPLAAWGLVLHDPDLAEAILDRVLERGRLVELRGASYRTRHLKRAESDRSPLREGAIISGNQVPEFPEPTRPSRVPYIRDESGATQRVERHLSEGRVCIGWFEARIGARRRLRLSDEREDAEDHCPMEASCDAHCGHLTIKRRWRR